MASTVSMDYRVSIAPPIAEARSWPGMRRAEGEGALPER
jgi:hypothetical protein